MRFLAIAFLTISLVGCHSGGPGGGILPSTYEVNTVVPADRTVQLGPISPLTDIVSVEVAPASDPTAYKQIGGFYFNGVHHGGTLPGYVVIKDGQPGDIVRVKLR